MSVNQHNNIKPSHYVSSIRYFRLFISFMFTMGVTKLPPNGFGGVVPRFGKITGHPNLDPSGLYAKRDEGCDPCHYHPVSMDEVYRVNKHKPDKKDVWKYKSELEDWSRNLGYRNQAILRYHQWMKSLGGPAWCTVPEPKKYHSACQNVGFGTAPRFKTKKACTPPPGRYYKAEPYTAPYGPHSDVPSFEWGEACRFKSPGPPWSLAPDRYTIVDKDDISMKPKKIVSLRGPYDLFTGKRDGSSIKNHFNRTRLSAATWPLALPGSLTTYKKSRFGVMNKTGRDKPYRGRNALVDIAMVVRRADEPGAADLNLVEPKEFKQNAVGFNSSYDRPPGYVRTVVWPGVGRYNAVPPHCGPPGHGHRHVFLSKSQRTIGAVLPEPMNTF